MFTLVCISLIVASHIVIIVWLHCSGYSDEGLYLASLKYFEEAGFKIIKKTYDLHSEPDFWYNIETEHEKMFSEQGIKIKALVARR